MLNRVILMGRLVADPELRQTSNNISVCKFTIAVNRPYSKDKEKQADFIRITAWRSTAEFVSRYFNKGKMIIVEGSLRNNDYTDNNGVKHYSMEVFADNVTFGESKSASEGPSINLNDSFETGHPAQKVEKESEPVQIGDLNDFEEILSDGEIPF